MRIYLAAAFSRREEMKIYREELNQLGMNVQSRWLDEKMPFGCDREKYLRETAFIDVADVKNCDLLVRFTDNFSEYSDGKIPARLGSCARMFEFGLAWGAGIPIIVVGGLQNVFDRLPNVIHINNFAALKEYLRTSA